MLFHNRLVNRYEFSGLLLAETGLHIGTGRPTPTSNAGVIRDFQGRPFIPGSSLKGALRSGVERRAEWLGLTSCRLEEGFRCLSTDKAAYDCHRDRPLSQRLQELNGALLCETCRLFGSRVVASKVQIDDLPLDRGFEVIAERMVEVRDGVGIERDSGTAAEGVKFDYEVVPSLTAFSFFMTAENLELPQLALLAVGLLEMMEGSIPLGGKSTRGLGRCRLKLQHLYRCELTPGDALTATEQLLRHLERGRENDVPNPRDFLLQTVRDFMERRGHAQTTGQ